jgi:hypothetical protein
MRRDDRRRVA